MLCNDTHMAAAASFESGQRVPKMIVKFEANALRIELQAVGSESSKMIWARDSMTWHASEY